ncbi:MAG: alanine:cation symporter family protein, partial [Planctomycetes bacterium]|nr:alanine:cation symporter family protein [Planctomycetota bacterium]
MDIAGWMATFSGWVWSTPTALLLTGAGLLFSIMTFGIQWKAVTHGFAVIRGKYDNPEDEGNISHFKALCAALSATIGLGNIAGVAVAVATGGPGAVFWMWVVGFLGMATKFSTCSLATMYRRKDKFGEYRGGPMYYIEMGLGELYTAPAMKKFAKILAVTFAILGMSASVGAGNMFQANQVGKTFVNLAKNVSDTGITKGAQFGIQMTVGAVLCIAAGFVMIGGIKRIGNVASKLVPSMCVIYVLGALYIIIKNIDLLPQVFGSIFHEAFSPAAGLGAFYGVAVRTAMSLGVKRACFSNEAGLGSAPIAHATAKTSEPIREGVVAAVGPFIDTIVICTITALVVLITGTLTRGPVATIAEIAEERSFQEKGKDKLALDLRLTLVEGDDTATRVGETLFVHKAPEKEGEPARRIEMSTRTAEDNVVIASVIYKDNEKGRAARAADRKLLSEGREVFLFKDGVELTALAFDRGLPGFGTYLIPIAALLFAFSTIISWGFYGETCAEYLFGERAVMPFKFVYVAMILVGTWSMELKPILDWSDAMLGLMLVPNLIGTLLLSPIIIREGKKYFRRLKAGDFEEEARRATEARRRIKEGRT